MKSVLEKVLRGEELSDAEASAVASAMSDGGMSEGLAGAMLAGLRAKGETAGEIAAFARVMLARAKRVEMDGIDTAACIDIVGTGGDGSGSLNISTASAIVAAGTGLRVLKHGNRGVSSACGAADVLEKLGVAMPIAPERAAACVREAEIVFVYAPAAHPALAALAGVRRALGVRTILNLLGPLTNPLRPGLGLIGVSVPTAAAGMARAAVELGMRRCVVVHSRNGWDEATPACEFVVHRAERATGGRVEVGESVRSAGMYGLPACREEDLRGGDVAFNARAIRELLAGKRSAFRDTVLLTVALALEVAGETTSAEGVARAAEAIDSGKAAAALEALVKASSSGGSGWSDRDETGAKASA